MTIHVQGATAALYVQWYEYAGGPLADVNAVTVTITPLAGGAAVVGPTSVGVGHPATGTYTYPWAIPTAQTPGDYLVAWTGTDAGTGTPVVATEIITVAATATATLPVGLCEAWEPIWCCTLPTGSQAATGYALQAATEVMWQATGQRFGLCTVTLRPCRRECATTASVWPEWSGAWPRPTLLDGQWFNLGCGGCAGGCSCSELQETLLPGPVYDVLQVKVDGTPLATNAYRLDDDRLLVRVDGGMWPTCQHLDLPDTAVGTWSVTARFGEAVPALGRQAVGELACEMVRACLGEDCRLPANVQALVRQGVSITFPDPEDLAERGYFGGLFVRTYNPNRLRGRAQVYDVDGPGFRRTGT